MRRGLSVGALLVCACSGAVVLDRISILVNDRVIKASDIDRDVRVTSFINEDPLSFTPATRKKAAERLIDQALIRREVDAAAYPAATNDEITRLLEQLRKQRGARFAAELTKYGISEDQLRRQLGWQVTVLHFIEQRFRPGVLVSDEEVKKYFEEHKTSFRRTSDGAKAPALEEVRDAIEQQIAGERVNTEFFSWLERARKRADVRFREADLK